MDENRFHLEPLSVLRLVLDRGGWFLAIAVVFASLMAVAATNEVASEVWMSVMGRQATGQVVALFDEDYSCGRKRRYSCTRYMVSARFDVNGAVKMVRSEVSVGYWRTLTPGGLIEVTYLEDDPNINRLEAHYFPPLFPLLIGFSVAVGFSIELFRRLNDARRLVYLRTNGLRRRAQVVKQDMTGLRMNSSFLWKIAWSDADGRGGESRAHWKPQLPEVGAEITVYVDPEGKLAPAWEGDWA